MADLANGEVAVDYESNRSTMGPSGRRARKPYVCYLLVGGTSDTYKVTVSTKSAHFCVNSTGEPCKGNTYGKAKKYGNVHQRDRTDPQQWCKHVAAALRAPEKVAEAQEITAEAFGERRAEVVVKAPKPAFPSGDARDRIAALEREKAALLERIEAEEAAELRDALAPLVERFGISRVREAAEEIA